MDRREFIAAAGSVAAIAPVSQAYARMGGAFLDHAVPGVGLTVSGPVRELRLYFNLGVIAAFSDVQVTSSPVARITTSRPVNDPSDQQIVIVRFRRALPPGTYMVSWHVVSIYERPTSGHSISRSLEHEIGGVAATLDIFRALHCNAKVARYFPERNGPNRLASL